MVGSCAVYGCRSTRHEKGKSFFRFPLNKSRCRQWIKACMRIDLMTKSEETLNKGYVVCELHFDAPCRYGKKLKCDAVPTLMLPHEDNTGLSKSTQTCSMLVKHEGKDPSTSYSVLTCDNTVLSFLTPQLQKLINLQEDLYVNCGKKYNKEFKLRALSLFFASPLAYKVLSKTTSFPNERILRRVTSNKSTIISSDVLKCLKSKIQEMKESEKYCVVCVDEMPLKRHLFYEINKDTLVGLEDIGGSRTVEPATRAFVIMVRGIFHNWNQPLTYSFLSQNKTYNDLNNWITNTISKMIDIGLKVVGFVSKQGANTFNMSIGRKVEKIFFFVDGNKIYDIIDIPYLWKSLRDILMKYDMEFYVERTRFVASWNDIKTFYELEKKREYILAPQLTASHIKPNESEKKELKYVKQVFSKKVATGMGSSIELNQFSETCLGTLQLVELVSDIFDALNSPTVNNPNKYSKQIETLNKFIKCLSKVSLRTTENHKDMTEANKSLKELNMTMTSIRILQKMFIDEGLIISFTQRLNLDNMERFFTSVKQQNGKRVPTPIKFKRAFNKLFTTHLFQHSEKSHVNDLDKLLVKAHSLVAEQIPKTEQATESDKIFTIAVGRTDYRLDLPKENTLRYICGYLLKACNDIHKCDAMQLYFQTSKIKKEENICPENDNSFEGIDPPDKFLDFVKALDTCIEPIFKSEKMVGYVGNEILKSQNDIIFHDCCHCFPTDYLKKLFIRFRIYNILRFNAENQKIKEIKREVIVDFTN